MQVWKIVEGIGDHKWPHMDAEPHVPISTNADATFNSRIPNLTSLLLTIITTNNINSTLTIIIVTTNKKSTKCLNIFYRGPESDNTAGGGRLGFINIDASSLFKYFQKQQTILHLCILLLLLLYIFNPSGYSKVQKKTT